MEQHATIIEWELIAILVTLIGGFVGLAFQIGRKSSDLEAVEKDLQEVKAELKAHDDQCKVDKAAMNARLAEGSTELALLKSGQGRIESDVKEVRRILEGRPAEK